MTSRSYIGRPTLFKEGPLENKRIITRISEVQKADRGRRCGTRDRRPVDPPPIVCLRLYEVRECGPACYREEELTQLTEVENAGWACQVDLFPAPQTAAGPSNIQRRRDAQAPLVRDNPSYSLAGMISDVGSPQYTYPPPLPRTVGGNVNTPPALYNLSYMDCDAGRWNQHAARHSDMVANDTYSAPATPRGEVLAYHLGAPVLENSACTTYLVGTLIATSSLVSYGNENQIMFIFHDISVKEDGEYFFRYRAFNTMYRIAGETTFPIVAECFGGPFTVYGTKDFPGLSPSTELTRLVMHAGVPVHYRETERKRRKSLHSGTANRELYPAPPPPPAMDSSPSTATVPIPAPQAYHHAPAGSLGIHPDLRNLPRYDEARGGGRPGPL